jgi:hypothetical protein
MQPYTLTKREYKCEIYDKSIKNNSRRILNRIRIWRRIRNQLKSRIRIRIRIRKKSTTLTRMQVLDLDIRIKSLEEALASSEATLRGEASLAAAKVLLFFTYF